jgi:hypothetical protein
MKKAQMEIVGLMIIVIVIVVVFMFIVSNSLRDVETRQDPVIEFTDTHISGNFGPVLMESSSNCTDANNRKLPVKELVEICIVRPEFQCGDINVCNYLNQTIETITENTFEVWGYKYMLTIERPSSSTNELITNITKDCTLAQNSNTNVVVIPTSTGSARMTLRMCV